MVQISSVIIIIDMALKGQKEKQSICRKNGMYGWVKGERKGAILNSQNIIIVVLLGFHLKHKPDANIMQRHIKKQINIFMANFKEIGGG